MGKHAFPICSSGRHQLNNAGRQFYLGRRRHKITGRRDEYSSHKTPVRIVKPHRNAASAGARFSFAMSAQKVHYYPSWSFSRIGRMRSAKDGLFG
jgi:hypothetical protein